MYKVLPDENLPVKIKYRLQDICEIYTVNDKGWNALENGNLINVKSSLRNSVNILLAMRPTRTMRNYFFKNASCPK